MAAAGPAIIFMFLLLAQVLIGIYVAAYASHCLLTVVQDTAAGNDEVIWPDEPIYDWVWKAPYLAWLLAFWLVPAGIYLKVAKPEFLAETPFLRFVLVALPGLWLMFPISLLSSLSARSRWVFFRPKVLLGLARFAPSVAVFYVVTALLLASCAACFYCALIRGWMLMIPIAATAGAALILIYARLLGRLGWLLSSIPLHRPAPAKQEPPRKAAPARKRRRPAPTSEVHDPWKVPKKKKKWEQDEPPTTVHTPEGLVQPYGLSGDEPPTPTPEKHKVPFDGPAVPYGVAHDEPLDSAPGDGITPARGEKTPTEPEPMDLPTPSLLELRIGRRPDKATPPALPLFTGVYTFPWYSMSMKAWIFLFLGLLLLQGLYALGQGFNPG